MAVDISKIQQVAKNMNKNDEMNLENNTSETVEKKAETENKNVDNPIINKFDAIMTTVANTSESLTKDFERVLGSINNRTKIKNEHVYKMKKLEEDRKDKDKKLEAELAKYMEKSKNDLEKYMEDRSTKHSEEMERINNQRYELETKRIAVVGLLDSVKEMCSNQFKILNILIQEGIIEKKDYIEISEKITNYLNSLNNIPLMFTQNNAALITKDK